MPITHPSIYREKNRMHTSTWTQIKNDLNSGQYDEGTVVYRYNLAKRGVVSNNSIVWDDDLNNA